MTPEATTAIGQAIQLAVAPALILVAIGNLINVVAVRLARIIDRARSLERDFPSDPGEERTLAVAELGSLGRRMKLCHASVGFITAGGILQDNGVANNTRIGSNTNGVGSNTITAGGPVADTSGTLVLTRYIDPAGAGRDAVLARIAEGCGWELEISPGLVREESPTPQELSLIRGLMPDRYT